MASIKPAASKAAPAAAPKLATAEAASARARVLVVDDDERNLLAIRTVLEEVAEVVVASSGEEALRHLLKGEFAVILLDVYMPGMDGYETAQMVRSREQTKRIPIVFLSAVNKDMEHLLRGYSMGAVDYVFKPVDATVLRSKVAVFVDLFNMTKEVERKARAEQELLDANLKANAELLRTEQELRRAQQRQAAIIESLPIILYLEPLEGNPRQPGFVSGNFEAVTGYTYGQAQERAGQWSEQLHPEDRERVMAALDERKRTGALAIEYRWRCASGEYKHFLDQAVLLRDPAGKPVEYAGTLMDVTDRRLLESQLVQARKMDAIGQLTGGIAHDFNNLLAAVLGGLSIIEKRLPLEDDHKKILGMARHAAEQGSELVRRLLAFARRQQLQPDRIEINHLAKSVSDLVAHTLGGLVEVEWQIAENPGCAFADEAQLELALMNLIINARDAMPEGGTITVAADNRKVAPDHGEGDLAPGDYVVLSVTDTGHGIAPDMIEQVMEPFFTTKEVGKGTGLGLSMVYGFAKQSGGAIRIASHVGKGTRVEIWLPRAEASEEPHPGKARETAEEPDGDPLRILLVDDHDGVRAITAGLLGDMGHQVTTAGDGPEALALIQAAVDGFDLLVSDYAMPKLSGAELIRQARERMPGLPAIIITGYADTESIGERPANVAILPKPFTPEQMRSCLTATMEGAKAAA
ncbi:response regulator [Sphingosinicella sp. YJ22]|uniref:response regulator n=1 Tax=Sphingosinicella sp. YJ22 TaxID=1104780 RepID=UPI00140BC36F|nr:response regulator [Sphingosinicella sp. YJ22]